MIQTPLKLEKMSILCVLCGSLRVEEVILDGTFQNTKDLNLSDNTRHNQVDQCETFSPQEKLTHKSKTMIVTRSKPMVSRKVQLMPKKSNIANNKQKKFSQKASKKQGPK